MPYTGDPENNTIDRIRLNVGDVDPCEESLSDDVYTFLLNTNDQDEKLTSLAALKYIVASFANAVTEKTGEVFIKDNERYEQYKDLLDKWTKDPSYMLLSAPIGYTGGIYADQILANKCNTNNVGSPFTLGWSTRGCTYNDHYKY